MIHVEDTICVLGGCSVHRRVTMMHVGDIMIHAGDIMSTSGLSI